MPKSWPGSGPAQGGAGQSLPAVVGAQVPATAAVRMLIREFTEWTSRNY